jgi:hypothetical protein
MRPLSEIRHDAEEAHLTGSLGKTSYSLLFDVPALCDEVERLRSLLDSAEYELDWLTLHHVIENGGKDWKSKFDGSAFYDCDCSESAGYMEWDTNAYIHTEQCASGHEDSLAALHDQIRQALGKR